MPRPEEKRSGTVPPATPGVAVGGWGSEPHRGIPLALLLISTALLTLEVSLTRLFSFTVWYHLAYLTISVALLGFGASGAIVASFPGLLRQRGHSFLVALIAASGILTVAALVVLGRYPLEIELLTQAPLRFSVALLAYYVAVALPFLLAGFGVGVPFAAYPDRMGRLYCWDLVGAALGCLFVVLGIERFGVPGLIIAAAGLLFLGAAALGLGQDSWPRPVFLSLLGIVTIAVAAPLGSLLPVNATRSKGLPDRDDGDSFSKWTALNRVDASGWRRPTIFGFWNGTGIMDGYDGPKPPVAWIRYDGSNGSEIYPFYGTWHPYAMLDHHLLRTPYVILEQPKVLVIGVGGGIDMVNAIYQGARHVTGVELQPETVGLLKQRLRRFTGGFYDRPDVKLLAGEGRHFVRKSRDTFDLIQITAVDTFAAQATGAYVLAESYLYTVEAMLDYFARLAPDGLLSMIVGDLVYRDGAVPLATRLALIARSALADLGVANPSDHLMVIGALNPGGGAQSEEILVKKSPFTADELRRITEFAAEKGFPLLYAPGQTNDSSYPLTPALGPDESERRRFLSESWFRLEPVRDRNPFFYNVAKWENFSPRAGLLFNFPGSFVGQLVLLLMIVQSAGLGLVFIGTPLLLGAREGLRAPNLVSYLTYFLALGVGFMFIEISFVQSFVLFLGSPTYALSVTIFSLLLFAAMGSAFSTRFADRPRWALGRIVPLLAGLIVIYAFSLGRIFTALLHLELPARILIAVLAQLPMGFILGMFMPLGIACIARAHPRLVPWAWGVNGVGSVVGTTLAVVLAMSWGFPVVALIAAAFYLLGTLLLVRASD